MTFIHRPAVEGGREEDRTEEIVVVRLGRTDSSSGESPHRLSTSPSGEHRRSMIRAFWASTSVRDLSLPPSEGAAAQLLDHGIDLVLVLETELVSSTHGSISCLS